METITKNPMSNFMLISLMHAIMIMASIFIDIPMSYRRKGGYYSCSDLRKNTKAWKIKLMIISIRWIGESLELNLDVS